MSFSPEDIIAHTKAKFGDRLDAFWKLVDRRRMKRSWPDYCFFPTEEWCKAMMQMLRRPFILAGDTPDLLAIQTYGAWRPSKDIVRFDTTVYDALLGSKINGSLPAQALMRMPAWCIYVEAPGLVVRERECQGFFARFDYADEEVLNITFVDACFRRGDPDIGLTVPIRLADGSSLVDSIEVALDHIHSCVSGALRDQLEDEVRKNAADSGVPKAISLLLYVCSQGLAPLGGGGRRSDVEQAPAGRRASGGWRLGAAPHSTVHVLGAEIGERLRAAEARARKPAAGGTHASPRPHMRAGHWHGHWHGPLDGERELLLHWQWPTPVALSDDDDDEAETSHLDDDRGPAPSA